MNDILTLLSIVILPSWALAILVMRAPKRKIVRKLAPLKEGESGAYDPAMDEDKVMKGEVESYFD